MPKGKAFTLRDVLADECCAPDCYLSPEPEYPVPLCARHLANVIRAFHNQLATMRHVNPFFAEDMLARQEREAYDEAARRKRRRVPQHVVYFIRFGDRLKIGTTGDLANRLRVLPHDDLLGTIPGNATTERQWHARWADIRITGEWFHATDELLAAIQRALAEAA